MDEGIIALTYGGARLELTKSDRLIGIKPRAGRTKALKGEIQALQEQLPVHDWGSLGGFELLEMGGRADAGDRLDDLRHHSAVAAGTHVFHSSDDGVPFVPTGNLFIEVRDKTGKQDCQELLDRHHLEFVTAPRRNEMVVRITPQSANPVKVAAALQQSPLVAVAEPELATPGQLKAFVLPSDSLNSNQWYLRNTGFHRGTDAVFTQGADARVVSAWETADTMGARQVVVAVIDDGFDLDHPDMIVEPWDFTRNSAAPLPDPEENDGHGAACAGLAIGRGDGGRILGAAPGCRFMPLRWGRWLCDSTVEAWFDWATSHGAWVISCSWGAAANVFPLSTRMRRGLDRSAHEGRNGLGCVIVFAAGNGDRAVNDPERQMLDGFACHPAVIAVAASTSRDQRAPYSNYGKEIWVCAPSSGAGGAGILNADEPAHSPGRIEGEYSFDFGGTSGACPLVAGICALILSTDPTLTAQEVKQILARSARRIGDGYDADGHSIHFGYGCVDAEAAVHMAQQVKFYS